jgi:hypothetical protein
VGEGGNMALDLMDRALEYLEANQGQSFTALELAKRIYKTYKPECEENRKSRKKEYKTDGKFIAQLAAEIGSHRKYLDIRIQYEGSPLTYRFASTGEKPLPEDASIVVLPGQTAHESKHELHEFSLYPVLYKFAKERLDVRTMRINEKSAQKMGGKNWNRWLHPDMVGLEVIEEGWDDAVRECSKYSNSQRVRVWSFEVKFRLEGWNFREAFFQAVSNSSWANFAYVVADQIESTKIIDEIRILSRVHGVGLIRLNKDNTSKAAEILIPAKEREYIEWSYANRLAIVNSDFRKFLDRIVKFFKTDDPDVLEWPEPLADGSA